MRIRGLGLLTVLLGTTLQLAKAATIQVYIAPPGVQADPLSGTEYRIASFNSPPVGNYDTLSVNEFGAYDTAGTVNGLRVQNADQYGGASGSRYMTFGAQNGSAASIALTLSTPRSYFGFWWSAGDANNGLTFVDVNGFVARFSAADIVSVLSPSTGTVTAIDGTVYNNSSYYGNPNPPAGRNTREPYAFVMFFFTDTQVSRIIFDNAGSTGTGFESDNHTVRTALPDVYQPSVWVKTMEMVETPEPGTMATVAGALVALGLLRGSRRSRAAGGAARDQRRA
ncbi:MAG: hypothetical protein HXY18_16510 [Bryobacteraceae bacterium]|nr:hypothetical protein [Bryobacteraceae bacterium]